MKRINKEQKLKQKLKKNQLNNSIRRKTMGAIICPTCQGTRVDCPTCGLPPKRKLPKSGRLYGALYGAAYWEVSGVDLSKWNGLVDFSITKTKCQYGFIRLGYSTQWKDASADVFYQNALINDFPLGGYWYCRIGEDVNLTGQSFAEEYLSHSLLKLDPVIDAEQTSLNPVDTLNWLKAIDTKVTNLTGKKPLIYTSAGFWNTGVTRSGYWAGRNLWVANWTLRDIPYLPFDWSTWLHWQWSADGNGKAAEYGSTNGDRDMDLDRFNGTCVQFNARYGTHIVPLGSGSVVQPPQPPPGVVPEIVIVNTGEANLRHTPDPVAQNVCATSKLNMKLYPEAIEKDQFGKEWYRLGKRIYIKKELTRLP
jgi:GH25 family lysozyme M1 (1,4-beta-N-acetylmuramidase)